MTRWKLACVAILTAGTAYTARFASFLFLCEKDHVVMFVRFFVCMIMSLFQINFPQAP